MSDVFRGKCHDCGIEIEIIPATDKNAHIEMTHNHSKEFKHRCTVFKETKHVRYGHTTFSSKPEVIATFP